MPDDQRSAVASLFDRTADTYEAVGVDMFGPMADGLVAALALKPGEQAADIGCGRGAVLSRLADAVGPSGRVVGLDLAPRMVELTASDVASAGWTHVEVRLGDAQEPDLPPGSFDVVASSAVLFFLPDPLAALRAYHTLLVPGGRLGVATFGPFSDAWRRVDDVFKPHLPPLPSGARNVSSDGPFGSDEGMEALVRDAGFGEVRTEHRLLHVEFADNDQWHEWTWSVGQRRMWEAVPVEQHDEVRAKAYAALDDLRASQGWTGFDQTARYTLAVRPG